MTMQRYKKKENPHFFCIFAALLVTQREYAMYRELTKKPYVAPALTVVVFRPEQGLFNSGLGPDPQTSSIDIESRIDNHAAWTASDATTDQEGWIY